MILVILKKKEIEKMLSYMKKVNKYNKFINLVILMK